MTKPNKMEMLKKLEAACIEFRKADAKFDAAREHMSSAMQDRSVAAAVVESIHRQILQSCDPQFENSIVWN